MLFLRLLGVKDTFAYVLCSLFGYAVFLAFRPAVGAGAAAALTTYHLFLGFRVIASDPPKDSSRSYGLAATIAAHLGFVVACVVARIAVVYMIVDSFRSQPKPLVGVSVTLGMKAIAIATVLMVYGFVALECKLLFSGRKELVATEMEPVFVEMSANLRKNDTEMIPATGDDHHAWVQYCSRRSAKYYNPGVAPKDDFEQWLRAHGKTQFPLSQSNVS